MLILLALLAGFAIWQFAPADHGATVGDESASGAEAGEAQAPQEGAIPATLNLPPASELQRAPAPPGQDPPPRQAIHGRVLRSNRSPVAAANVRLSGLPSYQITTEMRSVQDEPDRVPVAAALTAEDGSFRFDGPLFGKFFIEAESGDALEYRFPIPAGDYVEIVLGSGCRIEGRVLCTEHEAETFRGEVWLATVLFASEHLLSFPINADGSYALDSLPVGTFFLGARLDGHDVSYGFKSVPLLTWGSSARMDLHAEPGVVMEGRVLDGETNAPIPGATVWINRRDGATPVTDGEGRFRLQEIRAAAPDSTVPELIHASAPGYATASAPFEFNNDFLIRIPRELPLPLRITGCVLDADGEPVVGALIRASGTKGGWSSQDLLQSTTTDSAGSFFLLWREGLSSELGIHTAATGNYYLGLGWVRADLSLGDLHLPALSAWDVRVTDASGAPVAGAVLSRRRNWLGPDRPDENGIVKEPVRFFEPQYTTDSFGRCSFLSERSGAFDVSVAVGMFLSRQWDFPLPAADESEHVLVLENLRRVPCRVLTADRKPAEDFFITVIDAEHPMPDYDGGQGGVEDTGNLFVSSAGGLVLVEGRFQRKVSIVIHGDFVPVYRRDGVALDVGPIEIVLPWTATCIGRVVDAAGKPVAAATLLLIEEGKETACAETDAAGKFSVTLQKGKFYALVAVDASGRRSEPVGAGRNTSGLVLRIKE